MRESSERYIRKCPQRRGREKEFGEKREGKEFGAKEKREGGKKRGFIFEHQRW